MMGVRIEYYRPVHSDEGQEFSCAGSHSLGRGERTVDLSSSSVDAHEFAKEMVLGPWHG